jgi:hypothetical protein
MEQQFAQIWQEELFNGRSGVQMFRTEASPPNTKQNNDA